MNATRGISMKLEKEQENHHEGSSCHLGFSSFSSQEQSAGRTKEQHFG